MKTFYYATIRGLAGYAPAYLGLDLADAFILSTTPALFSVDDIAHIGAEKLTRRHGGTFTVHKVDLKRP